MIFLIQNRNPEILKSMLSSVFFMAIFFSNGQSGFNGQILYRQDSTPVAYAAIRILGTEIYCQTNAAGDFSLNAPAGNSDFYIEVFAIGLRDTILCKATSSQTRQILFTNKITLQLSSVDIEGYTARKIVEKAVEAIPLNYTDSGFAAWTFLRKYQQVNGLYRNLAEVEATILFILSLKHPYDNPSYGFYVQKIRRSPYSVIIDDLEYNDGVRYFLNQNPVYNLTISSLNPNGFDYYLFSFDSSANDEEYAIRYSCNKFSSESHGIDNFVFLKLAGEAVEEGLFIIDKETFAFKRIERSAVRNMDYNYPYNNNWLLPSRDFFVEFSDAKFIAEYEKIGSKWFLKFMGHRFTSHYYKQNTSEITYTITETTEWYCDSVSHFISETISNSFVSDTSLTDHPYVYDSSQWNESSVPPWYFENREDVLISIGQGKTPEQIFTEGGLDEKSSGKKRK
ncbi:MAG: hypothetical protein AB7V36_11485 [Bacteroidales bacterium]